MTAIIYRPPGKVARAFMHSTAFFRGLMGPFGSGKSTVCVMEILKRAKAQKPGPDGIRRSRWAVIRNTYPELKTTTIKTWHQWVPPSIGRFVWLPMEVSAAEKSMKAQSAFCTECGNKSSNSKPIVMANEMAALMWGQRHPSMATEVVETTGEGK